ncbi:MAG: GntR family transcriptional regulator [Oscillospiraceae bacterium]|nr:GntR family transcriptional regulator [Oscillospiraceae bacterium]MDY3258655.1 GntR family transcriptional regulator [Ruminococcus callidus]
MQKYINMNIENNKVFDYILDLIKNGNIVSGSRLPSERKISADLSLSRNSARESLRSLEIMGITESIHGSGNYLKGDISESISFMLKIMILLEKFSEDDVCSFRKMLEKAVCSKIIEENDRIDELIEKAEKILNKDEKSSVETAKNDKDFHYLLINASKNSIIISFMEAISNIYSEFIDSVIENADDETKKSFSEAHFAILQGLKEKNIEKCFNAIDFHYKLIDLEKNKYE